MWFVAEDCVWLRRIGGQLVRIFDQVLRICHVLLKQASQTCLIVNRCRLLQTFILPFFSKSFQLNMPICTNSFICETETAFLIIIVKLNEIIEKYNKNKNNHPYIKSGGSHKSDLDFDKTQFTQISQVISQ